MAPYFGRILSSTAFTLTPRSLKILEYISLNKRLAEWVPTLTFADGHIRALLNIEERAFMNWSHRQKDPKCIAQDNNDGRYSRFLQQQRTYLGLGQHHSDEHVLRYVKKRIASTLEICQQDQRNLEAAGKIFSILTRVFGRLGNLQHIQYHGMCDFHHRVPGLTWPVKELHAYLPKSIIVWLLEYDTSSLPKRFGDLPQPLKPTNDYTESFMTFNNICKAIAASQTKLQSLFCMTDAFPKSSLTLYLQANPVVFPTFESLRTLYWSPSDTSPHSKTVSGECKLLWIALSAAKGLKALHLSGFPGIGPAPANRTQLTLPNLEILDIQGHEFNNTKVSLKFLTTFMPPSLRKLCLFNISLKHGAPDLVRLFEYLPKLHRLELFRLKSRSYRPVLDLKESLVSLSARMSKTTIAWTAYIAESARANTPLGIPYPSRQTFSTNSVLKNGKITFYDVGPRWPTAEALDKKLDGRRFGLDENAGEGRSYDDVIEEASYELHNQFG
ncbi:hypothetical protein FKW77_001674 [Venturia effusa]|uniref:Uncharacterized protein n=1 Tax=Venturia effusa TaxID=50376 RepID=A0A517L8M3_9PEZI|nr:hypothetical protein FKW77_001674 [Venturia effusa]